MSGPKHHHWFSSTFGYLLVRCWLLNYPEHALNLLGITKFRVHMPTSIGYADPYIHTETNSNSHIHIIVISTFVVTLSILYMIAESELIRFRYETWYSTGYYFTDRLNPAYLEILPEPIQHNFPTQNSYLILITSNRNSHSDHPRRFIVDRFLFFTPVCDQSGLGQGCTLLKISEVNFI